MLRISRVIIALFLAVLTATIMPAQVFADTPDYISDIKIATGSDAEADLEGYIILSDKDNNPIDLNQNAGGGWGSKGENRVLLGYKTTDDSSEAITDLALMNMKGGYSVQEYEALMEQQMKSQILPFVESFIVAIDEYRVNYDPESGGNKQRADYIHDALNKLTDDDCDGKGLGDLLLNSTKFEMGDTAYNALLAEEQKNHADIVTIIAQANGQATLLLENLLVRACDVNSTSWVERFAELTYDDLVDSTGMTPTDAEKQLAKLYDDDAYDILNMWDAFREQLLKVDETVEKLEETDTDKMDENSEVFNNFDLETATESDLDALAEASVDAELNTEALANRITDFVAKEYLSNIEYGDGTMFDFFTQTSEEIEDDITVLYPLVASLSPGQRAGLEFITLSTLVTIAGTSDSCYSDAEIDDLETVSIYEGVDRAIYQKGGVALTSDALRKDAAELALNNDGTKFPFNWWTILSGGLALVSASALVYTFRQSRVIASQIKTLEASIASANMQMTNYNAMCQEFSKSANKLIMSGQMKGSEYHAIFNNLQKNRFVLKGELTKQNRIAGEEIERLTARSSTCNKLMVGLGVAMVILTAVTTYLAWQDMKAYYKVDFTPIPHYMIEAKDLIGYNSKGEKIVLKNQSAYYKAVECNRKEGDEYYKVVGTCADLNGDVGKQWLALYAAKNEFMQPILASSLTAVVGKADVPSGYTTGIHMFGSSAAFNLNSSLYDWNSSATSVFVYFKNEEPKADNSTASNFTGGSIALTGGAGLAIGALATAFTMKTRKKKDSPEEA